LGLIRPKLGVVSLDLIPDPIWRETVARVLQEIVDDYVDLARQTGTRLDGVLTVRDGALRPRDRMQKRPDSAPRAG
jgi:hypothetical protein